MINLLTNHFIDHDIIYIFIYYPHFCIYIFLFLSDDTYIKIYHLIVVFYF